MILVVELPWPRFVCAVFLHALGCLPRYVQIQGPQRAVHCYRGNVYWTVHLLRKEGYAMLSLILLTIVAAIAVGNTLPLVSMPEGTIICNVEEKIGDRGSLARAAGLFT